MLQKGTLIGKNWTAKWLPLSLLILVCGSLIGCAEGPFWRAGKYAPWAQNQWAEEERMADTLFVRKRRMNESVAASVNAPLAERQRVAQSLAKTLRHDPILLLRLHAVKLLGELNCPAAIQALGEASQDHTTDIRIAAVKAWGKLPAETAIPQLQEMIGSDSDTDVRMAATRVLGEFSGQKAVAAISLSLDDRNPALQLRAAESLEKVTGEQFGRDIGAWQRYVQNVIPTATAGAESLAAPAEPTRPKDSKVAQEKDDDSYFR